MKVAFLKRLFDHEMMFKLILIASVGLGIIARFMQLSLGIDYDEAYSYLMYMSQPLFIAVSKYDIPNNHILNSVIGHFTQQYLGSTPFFLRAGPFLAGLLCFPAIYLSLKSLFGKNVALFASCASFLSWPLIYYSAQARGYIYQILFIYTSLFFLSYSIRSPYFKNIFLLLAAFCAALGLWAIPTTLYSLVYLFFLMTVLFPLDWRKIVQWFVLSGALAFLLYFPALIYVGLFGLITFPQTDPFTVQQFQTQLAFFVQSFFGLPWWSFLILLFPFFASIVFLKKKSVELKAFVVLLLTITSLFLLNPDTINYDRLWIWTLPLFAAFVFAGIFHLCDFFKLQKFQYFFATVMLCILSFGSVQKVNFRFFEKSSHSESLYLDLKKEFQPGDYFSISQALGTELDYWNKVYGNDLPVTRFLISGDWKNSLYRLPADKEVLKKRVGKSSFFIIDSSSTDRETGLRLISDFTKSTTLEDFKIEELSHTSKRARIWKVNTNHLENL